MCRGVAAGMLEGVEEWGEGKAVARRRGRAVERLARWGDDGVCASN